MTVAKIQPKPVPTPTKAPTFVSEWNRQWNEGWNRGWNEGFNRQPISFGNGAFEEGRKVGYGVGLKEYQTRTGRTPGLDRNIGNISFGPVASVIPSKQDVLGTTNVAASTGVQGTTMGDTTTSPREKTAEEVLGDLLSGLKTSLEPVKTIPEFQFDYEQAEKEALEKLRPYYEEKLGIAQGDVMAAKKMIEEDYEKGKRLRAEDVETQTKEHEILAEEEKRNTLAELNRRGLLFGQVAEGQAKAPYSEYAQTYAFNPLQEKQSARKLAIERALQRQEEQATTTRKKGLEEQDTAIEKYKRALNEERAGKIRTEFVPEALERARIKYETAYGPYINDYISQVKRFLQGGQA